MKKLLILLTLLNTLAFAGGAVAADPRPTNNSAQLRFQCSGFVSANGQMAPGQRAPQFEIEDSSHQVSHAGDMDSIKDIELTVKDLSTGHIVDSAKLTQLLRSSMVATGWGGSWNPLTWGEYHYLYTNAYISLSPIQPLPPRHYPNYDLEIIPRINKARVFNEISSTETLVSKCELVN